MIRLMMFVCMVLCVPVFAADNSVPEITGVWTIGSSDLVAFEKGKVKLSPDPLYEGTEVVFKADGTGALHIPDRTLNFTWKSDSGYLRIRMQGKIAYEFRMRVVDENTVLVIQTVATRPNISVVGIARRKMETPALSE